MKLCLCCGHVCEADMNTCPKCGEASWRHMSLPTEPDPVAKSEDKPSKKGKRKGKTNG